MSLSQHPLPRCDDCGITIQLGQRYIAWNRHIEVIGSSDAGTVVEDSETLMLRHLTCDGHVSLRDRVGALKPFAAVTAACGFLAFTVWLHTGRWADSAAVAFVCVLLCFHGFYPRRYGSGDYAVMQAGAGETVACGLPAACLHDDTVPVDNLDGDIVARLCVACDTQLPAKRG